MKYGLREDKAFRKKDDYFWKIMVENEIKSLKKEVALGKKQLEELSYKMQFLAPNTQTSSTYTFTGNLNKPTFVPFMGKEEWSLPSRGTRQIKYKATPARTEDGSLANCLCITFMNKYNSFSLEELRLADYVIANSSPPYSEIMNVGPIWESSDNTSYSTADFNQDNQDVIWNAINGISSAMDYLMISDSAPKVKDSRVLEKYEELLGNVVSELKEVNKNIASVDSRLIAAETNLSEVSCQVSALDSKLHTLGVFVTMENWEKKWLTLKPWIESLENTPAKNNTEISHGEKDANESFEPDKIDTSLPLTSSTSTSILSPVLSVKESKPPTNVKPVKSCNSSQFSDYQNKMDTSASAQSASGSVLSMHLKDSRNNLNESSDYLNKINSDSVQPPSFSKNFIEFMKSNHSLTTLENMCLTTQTPTTKSKSLKVEEQVIECKENESLITDDNTKKCKVTLDNSTISSSEIQDHQNKTDKNDLEVSNNSTDLLKHNTDGSSPGHFEDSLTHYLVTNFCNILYANSIKKKSDSCSPLNGCNESGSSTSTLNSTNNSEDVQNSNEKGVCTTVIPSDDASSSEKDSSQTCEDKRNPENVILSEHKSGDIENEYVIVETKDIENVTQHLGEDSDCLLSPKLLSSTSTDKDFQVCSNVTEYLEVNLGKNKDETYKFTFKINQELLDASWPIYVPFSNENVRMKDDSFREFLSDFLKNKSPRNKQSSPLVMPDNDCENSTGCQSKPQKPVTRCKLHRKRKVSWK